MSSDFYTEMKETADELLAEFGKPVSLSRPSRTADLDSWEASQGPTATDAAQSITGLAGVQRTLDKEALALQTAEMRIGQWIFEASTAIPEEVDTSWLFTADGKTYPVIQVRPVFPGPLLLLYFAVVQL